jgi:hypothetical protein
MGWTSGDDIYMSGAQATVTATAYSLYRFVNWTVNGIEVSRESVYSFPVSEDRHLTANFEILDFTVNVVPDPIPGGMVQGGGNHIPYGELITVTATPNLEYIFLYWTIDGIQKSGNPEYSFNVIESVTVVAHFQLKTCDVLVWADPPAGGTVSGDMYNIPYGTSHTVSATPNPNYHFVNWTENDIVIPEAGATYTFIVLQSHNLTAHFALNTYDITLTPNPLHGGTTFGGGTAIVHGTVINALAVPNPHFIFVDWTENGTTVSTDALYPFTATGSRSLVANFISETFTVTVSADPPSAGELTGGGTDIPYLTEITVTATPDSCHYFDCWTEDGDTVSLIPEHTFSVTGNHNLVAHFTLKTFNIATAESPAGSGTTSGGGTDIPCGTEVTVKAIPEIGYAFVNWTENGAEVSNIANYTFALTDDRDLVANFIYVTHTISLEASPFYCGSVFTEGDYPLGYDLTVHAFANPEFTFVNWTENDIEVATDADYQFPVDRDRHLVAHFVDALFDVTVVANPLPGGTVDGNITGLTYGTWHTVTAIPNQYFVFVNWTENGVWVSDSATYHFPVHHTRHLVANFIPEPCIITLERQPSTGGTVSGSGAFPLGTPDTIRAFPASDYVFDKWTEADSTISDTPSYAFTVMASRHFVAHFKPKGYTITLTANLPDWGDVEGGGTYQYGEIAPVKAIAKPNYVFVNWTENGDTVSTSESFPFPVTRSRDLVANFRLKGFDVLVSVSAEGGGTVGGGGYNFPWGTDTAVYAYPFPDYDFVRWKENGVGVSTDLRFGIIVKEDRNLVAHFQPKMYHINVEANVPAWGTVTGGGDYAFLSFATVTADPHDGYAFDNWTEDGVPVSDSASYTFRVNNSRNLIANFKLATYNIILAVNPEGAGEVSGTEYNVPYGT